MPRTEADKLDWVLSTLPSETHRTLEADWLAWRTLYKGPMSLHDQTLLKSAFISGWLTRMAHDHDQ